jgi:uncharacterized membrane protein
LQALQSLWPILLGYILSFIYVGIYWNNHHHLLHAAAKTSGKVLWANLILLFWLSLFPFATAWVGETKFAKGPVIVYGIILFMAAISYFILSKALIQVNGKDSPLAIALGKDKKGIISLVLYLVGIGCTLFYPFIGFSFYAMVALIWFIPDRRIEKVLGQ